MSAITNDDMLDTEDFWSALKSVTAKPANTGSSVLTAGTPFLGPVGGPIAAVAGAAFGFLAARSSEATESTLDATPDYKAQASRAILSEAALQAVLEMDGDQWKKYGLSDKMTEVYRMNRKADVALASRVLAPALTSSAVHHSIVQSEDSDPTTASDYPVVLASGEMERSLNPGQKAFVANLQQAAQERDHDEGFVDFLGQVARTGIQADPIVINTIPESVKEEQTSLNKDSKDDKIDEHANAVLERSLMGEAALQALMTIPFEKLREEGVWGDIVGTVQNIGSTVIRVAPTVLRGSVAP